MAHLEKNVKIVDEELLKQVVCDDELATVNGGFTMVELIIVMVY